jgi:hypothetical protein
LPYGVGKGSKEKNERTRSNALHNGSVATISQQTIQNCFRIAGQKYQSNGNEMANDDDFGQDWEKLCRAQKYDFQSYVSVERHVATRGVETVEELCEAFGSTRSAEEDENEQEMAPSLTKLYKKLKCFSMRKVEATRTMKTFQVSKSRTFN